MNHLTCGPLYFSDTALFIQEVEFTGHGEFFSKDFKVIFKIYSGHYFPTTVDVLPAFEWLLKTIFQQNLLFFLIVFSRHDGELPQVENS